MTTRQELFDSPAWRRGWMDAKAWLPPLELDDPVVRVCYDAGRAVAMAERALVGDKFVVRDVAYGKIDRTPKVLDDDVDGDGPPSVPAEPSPVDQPDAPASKFPATDKVAEIGTPGETAWVDERKSDGASGSPFVPPGGLGLDPSG